MIRDMVFAKKRSTENALLDIIIQIETNMDGKLYSCRICRPLKGLWHGRWPNITK